MHPIVRLSVFCLLLACGSAFAQFPPGLTSSNYGGIYRVLQNPSAVAGSRYRYQFIPAALITTINPTAFRYLNSNDYVYTARLPYSNQLARDLRSVGSLDGPRTQTVTDLIGPSFLLSLGRAGGLAVHTRLRSSLYGRGLPKSLTDAYRLGLYSRALQSADGPLDINLSHDSHLEAGLTYGLVLFDASWQRLKVGATVRRIVGAQRQTLNAQGTYRVRPDAQALDLQNVLYVAEYTAARQGFQLQRVTGSDYGQGWAYDLGATYEIGRRTTGRSYNTETPMNDPRPAYILRLSAALLNGGDVRYPDGTIITGRLNRTLNQDELERFGDAPTDYLPNLAGSRSGVFQPGQSPLPRQVHLEADLRVARSFYVNALTVRQTGEFRPMNDFYVITPRFEDEDAEVALPISLIGPEQRVAVGASIRLGPIAFGFSDLNHFFDKGGRSRSSLFWVGVSGWVFTRKKD